MLSGLLLCVPELLLEHFVEQLQAGAPCVAPLRPQPLDSGTSALEQLRSTTFV
jgi:hypothetical protein